MPKGLPILRWTLTGSWRVILAWVIAVAAIAALYTSTFSWFGADQLSSFTNELPQGVLDALGGADFGSAAGYISSTVFGLLVPAILLVYGVMNGAGLIAGDEETGSLELEYTAPASRTRIFLERACLLPIALALCAVAVVSATCLVIVGLSIDGVDLAHVAATGLGLFLLTTAIAMLSIGVGAASGSRTLALGVGALVAAGSYLLNAIASMSSSLAWLAHASPWHWYLGSDPMTNGIDVTGYLALLGLAVVGVVIGLAGFRRRDLRGS